MTVAPAAAPKLRVTVRFPAATIWMQVASAGTLESAICARPVMSWVEPPPGPGTPTQPAVATASAKEPETASP